MDVPSSSARGEAARGLRSGRLASGGTGSASAGASAGAEMALSPQGFDSTLASLSHRQVVAMCYSCSMGGFLVTVFLLLLGLSSGSSGGSS